MSVVMPVIVEEISRDEQGRSGTSTESQFASRMYFYGREICFFLAILFTSYAALQNGTPKVSKSPAAVPFFTRTSLVSDFYHGQLSPAFERVSESDLSFVMYYAPWDAESQTLRSQFKAVAQYYYKQVYFAAINCWQPQSECRQQFSKIQMFPVLIAYSQQSKGVQYKGVKEAPHMIRFLRHLMLPLERVEHSEDLIRLMSSHDAVVLGSFHFGGNTGGRGFHTFYSTALKFLERDPQREIAFAVVTNERASVRLGMYYAPTVRLYLWNETLEYSPSSEYSVEALVKWCSVHTHQVSVWVSPPGVKSLTLSPYVEEGSVLLLFTPRNPFLEQDLNYNLLREVGLEYYNCDNNPWVSDLGHYLSAHREVTRVAQQTAEQGCQISRARQRRSHPSAPVQMVAEEPWANDSCPSVAHRRSKRLCGICLQAMRGRQSSPSDESCGVDFVSGSGSCAQPDVGYGPHGRHYVCCKQRAAADRVTIAHMPALSRPATSMLSTDGDQRSPPALLDANKVDDCRRLRRATQLHRPVFPRADSPEANYTRFKGLACRTNKTLSLLAMDSLQFAHFAQGLGVDVTTRPDKTAVIIFNAVDESAYTLAHPLGKDSLVRFIEEYTSGLLDRTMRSSDVEPHLALNRYPIVPTELCRQTDNSVCVPELAANTFHQFVMDNSTSVVLFYHSPFCAYCRSIAHLYLTTARYFRAVKDVSFARIDGDNNDLPWEFTMHHYPTFLFFPAKRKSESRVFPHHLPITVPNLVNFVLANMEGGEGRLQGLVGLCGGWSRAEDPLTARDCVGRARRECLRVISDTLAEYRSTALRWRAARMSAHRATLADGTRRLLFKLQHLREVQLLLGATDVLTRGGRELAAIQRSFRLYRQTLARDPPSAPSAAAPVRDEL